MVDFIYTDMTICFPPTETLIPMPLTMRGRIDSWPPYESPSNLPSVKKPRQDLISPTTTVAIEFYHDRALLGLTVNTESEVSPSGRGVSEPGLDTQEAHHNTRL